MVVAKIFAGLANQMMMYAAAKAYALDRNQPLLIETKTGFIDEAYGRKYGLDNFNITAGQIEASQVPQMRWRKRSNKLADRIVNKAIQSYISLTWDQYMTNGISPYQPFTSRKKNVYLNGLFFSEKYFKHRRREILEEFSLKHPFQGRNLEMEREMQSGESVAIHVRVISNPTEIKRSAKEIYGLLGNDYYNKALEAIASKHGKDLKCYVFSEDIPWVRENLRLEYPFQIMDQNDDDHNYLDIMLMSRCKHNIVAKSTFSWWSAWLNRNPGKTVVAPVNFFQNHAEKTRDIYPEEWIRM